MGQITFGTQVNTILDDDFEQFKYRYFKLANNGL